MGTDVPTYLELRDRVINDWRARFPDDDLAPQSDNFKRISVLVGATWGLYHQQKVGYDDLFPDTANGTDLDRIGAIWDLGRKGATAARKDSALRVTGTLASAFTLGDVLTAPSGLRYQLNESGVIPAALFIDVDVIAIDTGSATLLDAETVLTFSSPPAGIDAAAELQLAMDEGGLDQESDGDYRIRILNRIAQPGMGGNSNDYVQWSTAIDEIETAYVYRFRRGLGSVDLAVLSSGSGSARLPGAPKIAEVQAAIDDGTDDDPARPVSVKLFRVLTTTELEVDVDLEAEPLAPADDFDWDDSIPPVVSIWVTATRLLTFTAARPANMLKGHRLVIATDAGDGTGEEWEIESLSSTDAVVLVKVPSPVPVSPDVVYSGGPLNASLREDIVDDFIDKLGPVRGTTAEGTWIDDIDPQRLEGIALANPGVRTVTVNEPAVTATPTDTVFPNDTTVELLTPGEVIIRKKH